MRCNNTENHPSPRLAVHAIARVMCVLTVCMAALFAAAGASAGTMYSPAIHVKVGTHVVRAGDDAASIRDDARDGTTDIINAFGVKVGEEWLYDRGNGSWTVVRVNNAGTITEVLDMIKR